MKTCSPAQFGQYRSTFLAPDLHRKELIADDKVGLVYLPPDQFTYRRSAGYAFEVAAVAEQGTSHKLLFIRIDVFDPKERETSPPDYCIPIAYDGASDRERLIWTIGFGGGWSDCREDALLVFDSDWIPWFRSLVDGVAFSNEEAESAAYLSFDDRVLPVIADFCA